MTHEEYVKSLVKLQDLEGKRISQSSLNALKRILKASGSLERFMKLIQVVRSKMLKEIAIELRDSVGQARSLGKKFGASKLV